ncbi:hypothetical protein D4764_02G0005560 [Takifugu flavidus]|uniref:Uncharacterized protein n=1 Tax=Takifugu flavidus TaxID=433684 RepID=A0A5C6NKQ0_9TELE|nr:hypothetical protein D4764_02G0005560 [Takifugu flavidus]
MAALLLPLLALWTFGHARSAFAPRPAYSLYASGHAHGARAASRHSGFSPGPLGFLPHSKDLEISLEMSWRLVQGDLASCLRAKALADIVSKTQTTRIGSRIVDIYRPGLTKKALCIPDPHPLITQLYCHQKGDSGSTGQDQQAEGQFHPPELSLCSSPIAFLSPAQ